MRAALATLLVWLLPALAGASGHVNVMAMEGEIVPGSAKLIENAVERSVEDGALALVVELNTPGGFISSTQEIVSTILNAEVPVLVWVGPRGSWAGSAGTFITLSGHVAAMAPGTTIGAAHPVYSSQPAGRRDPNDPKGNEDYMLEKVENFTTAFIESIAETRGRNAEWAMKAVRESVAIKHSEALEKGVIDFVADDLDDLLEKSDGRTVRVGREDVVLKTAGARVERIEPTATDRIYHVLVNPQAAVLLLMLGIAGIWIEIQNPGLIVPAAVGALALLASAFAFQVLPFNWLGLVLIVLGVSLLIAELFFTSYGLLFVSGSALFAAGAFLVFRVPEVGDFVMPVLGFIVPVTATLMAFFGFAAWAVARTYSRRMFAGAEGLVGELATADSDLDPEGRVFYRGELWRARSDAPVRQGQRVEIVKINKLELTVRPADAGD